MKIEYQIVPPAFSRQTLPLEQTGMTAPAANQPFNKRYHSHSLLNEAPITPYLIHRIINGTNSAVIKPFKPMTSPENTPAISLI